MNPLSPRGRCFSSVYAIVKTARQGRYGARSIRRTDKKVLGARSALKQMIVDRRNPWFAAFERESHPAQWFASCRPAGRLRSLLPRRNGQFSGDAVSFPGKDFGGNCSRSRVGPLFRWRRWARWGRPNCSMRWSTCTGTGRPPHHSPRHQNHRNVQADAGRTASCCSTFGSGQGGFYRGIAVSASAAWWGFYAGVLPRWSRLRGLSTDPAQ
jgi:hypothetical protein